MEQQFFHRYRGHRFGDEALATIDRANAVIDDMRAQGYVLTLRQLYYKFVKANWIANSEREYKRLGRTVTRAREAGLMDWLAVEDRGREAHTYEPSRRDEARALAGAARDLYVSPWETQDHYVEVWVEKQALEGVVERPCLRWHVPHMACKGYLSASEAWRAGLRFRAAVAGGRRPVMVHLSDHDPSGLDMRRDNEERLRVFAEAGVEVRRVALTRDQVEEHRLPPNPAKQTDARFEDYRREHGDGSWELDALEPSVIDALVSDVVSGYVDGDRWHAAMAETEDLRAAVAAAAANWPVVRNELAQRGLI